MTNGIAISQCSVFQEISLSLSDLANCLVIFPVNDYVHFDSVAVNGERYKDGIGTDGNHFSCSG